MTLGEYVAEIDAYRDNDPQNDYAGNLTRADVWELWEFVNEAPDGAS